MSHNSVTALCAVFNERWFAPRYIALHFKHRDLLTRGFHQPLQAKFCDRTQPQEIVTTNFKEATLAL